MKRKEKERERRLAIPLFDFSFPILAKKGKILQRQAFWQFLSKKRLLSSIKEKENIIEITPPKVAVKAPVISKFDINKMKRLSNPQPVRRSCRSQLFSRR